MLQSMGSQRVRHNLVTKKQRIEENGFSLFLVCFVSLSSLFFSFFSHFLPTEKSENETIDLVLESDEIESKL